MAKSNGSESNGVSEISRSGISMAAKIISWRFSEKQHMASSESQPWRNIIGGWHLAAA